MPDTPTPAPALTDEQIDSSPADDPQIDDDVRALVEGESMPEETAWAIIAAVVARAKREERERIADDIQARATALLSSLDAMPEEKRQGGHMFVLNTIACANIARKEPEATNA